MKKTTSRIFALLVALLVLCAPVGAMAEQMQIPGVTMSMSNLSFSMGEDININLDVTARFDAALDPQTGAVAGTVTALSGSDEAIKAGFSFDMSTMNLTAGLQGVSDAVLLPMGEMIEQLQAQMSSTIPGGDMENMTAILNATSNLMNVVTGKFDMLKDAVKGKIKDWMNNVVTNGYKGQTTVTVAGSELPAEQYDYELTVQEAAAVGGDFLNAVKGDPELLAAIQEYLDIVASMSGTEERIDLGSMDVDALVASFDQMDAKATGSLYVIDNGSVVLDVNATINGETLPMRFAILSGESGNYAAFIVDASETAGTYLSLEANLPADGTPKFSIALNGVQGQEGNGMKLLISLEGDFSEGANVTLYAETNNSYTYGDSTYNALSAFGVNYAGTMNADEAGVAFPGRLILYVNSNGTEMTVGVDTLVSLNNNATVDFEMPHNVINLTEADEDTMNALSEEYMQALSNGLMILMGAPGVQDLMNLFGAAA